MSAQQYYNLVISKFSSRECELMILPHPAKCLKARRREKEATPPPYLPFSGCWSNLILTIQIRTIPQNVVPEFLGSPISFQVSTFW